ncbi:MAG: hypothetical protein AAB320_09455 [Elusimicrobiota bacterium]
MAAWLAVLLLTPSLWAAEIAPPEERQDDAGTEEAGVGRAVLTPEEQVRAEADVIRLEQFVMFHMGHRGAGKKALSEAFRRRLKAVLAAAARSAPLEFRYFTAAAPRFSEAEVTQVFQVLRDEPEGLAAFVRGSTHVQRLVPLYQEAAAVNEPEAGLTAAADREWKRYLEHRGPLVGKTLEGILSGMAAKAVKEGPSVSAGGPLKALGPAE